MDVLRIAIVLVASFSLSASNLLKTSQEFIDNHFLFDQPVVVVANFSNLDPQLDHLTTMQRNKILINPQFRKFLPYKNYIIVLEDSAIIIENHWNSRGRFLVILQKPATKTEIKTIFRKLWQRNIYNVAVLTTNGVVTWFPYSSGSKCGETVEIVTNVTDFFANKTKNLNGCPIKILWSPMGLAVKNAFDDNPGFAIVAVNNIAKFWNFTPNYMENYTDFTTKMIQNGGPEDLVEIVTKFRIDLVVMTLGFGTILENLETSQSLWRTNAFFVLPPRSAIRDGSSLYKIFPNSLWLIFLITATVMVITWKLLFSDSINNTIFTITRLTFQCMVSVKPHEISLRITIFFFVLYTTIFSAIYVSQLSSVLTHPSYEPKITTITNLATTGIPLKFYKPTALSLIPRSPHLYYSIMKQWRDPGKARTMQLLQEFLKRPDHGIVMTETHLSYLKNPNELEIVSDYVETFAINFNSRPDFPLLDQLNWWILEVREKGLILKWVRDSSVDLKKFVVETEETGDIPLKIQHVFGAFVVLISGSATAIVVLIAELMFAKIFTSTHFH